MTRRVLLLLLVLGLAACSGNGAPSEQNVRDALAKAGNRGAAQAKLLECKRSADRPGYVCDYRAPVCNRFTGTCGGEKPYTGRFLYAAGRWQQVESLTAKAAPDPAVQPLPGVVPPGAPPGLTPGAGAPPAPLVVPPLPAPGSPRLTPVPSALTPVDPEPELSRKDLRRVARWREADARCREGDDYACADLDELGDKLAEHDLCYGPPAAYGYERAWRPCSDRSR